MGGSSSISGGGLEGGGGISGCRNLGGCDEIEKMMKVIAVFVVLVADGSANRWKG